MKSKADITSQNKTKEFAVDIELHRYETKIDEIIRAEKKN